MIMAGLLKLGILLRIVSNSAMVGIHRRPGQVGLELHEQVDDLSAVYVAMGWWPVEQGTITFDTFDRMLGPLRDRRGGPDPRSLSRVPQARALAGRGPAAMACATTRSYETTTAGTTAVILCGSNVGVEKLRPVLA